MPRAEWVGRGARVALWHALAAIALAVLAVTLGARISVPVPESLGAVPITGQSLALLVSAALLGPRRGALAAAGYVALAAIGAPVLAEGRGGWDAVRGPSAGYLAGFVLGAAATGALAPRERSHFGRELAAQLVGTALILLCGWARLCRLQVAGAAFAGGVAPFVPGALLKVALGALLAQGLRAARSRRGTTAAG